jgi:hypothetical protein
MVALKDCSQEKDRVGCVEKNVTLLNGAFETVVKELRKRITDLENALANLEGGALKSGDKVKLESFDPGNNQRRGQYLTYIDHDVPTKAHPDVGWATPFQTWELKK